MIKTSCGTLIVAIPCKDGLVVSADKREVACNCRTNDDAVKIHQLGRFAAFGIAGAAYLYKIKESYKVVYDVGEIVNSFYLNRDTKFISQTWYDLKLYLENHFREFLSGQTPGREPEPPPGTRWFYILPFWYLTDNKINSTELKMRYVKKPKIEVECFIGETIPQERFQSAEALSYSHTAVIDRIRSSNDTRFDEYKNDHTIMRFLKESLSASNVKTKEAKAASKKLITITSKMLYLLEPPGNQVGATSNSILIDKKKGIISLDSVSTASASERTQAKKKARQYKR